jgi:hypothetical protein
MQGGHAMTFKANFEGISATFDVQFTKTDQYFKTKFQNLTVVERVDIPKQYGLITYTQNKIIKVT